MDIPQQAFLTIIVSIVTFLLGRKFEQRKITQHNRLELLKPVEEWVDNKVHALNIMRADLYMLAGKPHEVETHIRDDAELTATFWSEHRLKVFGILESDAFNTGGTKKLTEKLVSLLKESEAYDNDILFTAYEKATSALKMNPSDTELMEMFMTSRVNARNILQDIYSCLSELKIRLN